MHPGTKFLLKSTVDNSQCSSSISNFTFKLFRKSSFAQNSGKWLEVADYFFDRMLEGCGQKQSFERYYELQIPGEQQDGDTLTPSFVGETLKVEYKLKCFVKHSSVFETAGGNACEFPITIVRLGKADKNEEPQGYSRTKPVKIEVDESKFSCLFSQIPPCPQAISVNNYNKEHALTQLVFEEGVIVDDGVPLPDSTDFLIPLGPVPQGMAAREWPNLELANDRAWRE